MTMKQGGKTMQQHMDTTTRPTTLATSRTEARQQLAAALRRRGLELGDTQTPGGTWLEDVPSSYSFFWVRGGDYDLYLSVRPLPSASPSKGGHGTGPAMGWEMSTEMEVILNPKLAGNGRAAGLHEQGAEALAQIGFSKVDEDADEDTHLSNWELIVRSIDEAADCVLATLEVDCCQYPDGEDWMQGIVPLSSDQAERLIAFGVPVEPSDDALASACPIVKATGTWYWIPAVCPGGSIRLVGPRGEMAATVRASGHWISWAPSGDALEKGLCTSLEDAIEAAEQSARGAAAFFRGPLDGGAR